MNRSPRRVRALAIGLSALAGYVDAVGFLHLGGFFVSFMSGNSTRMSVALAAGAPETLLAAGLILAFVFGVTAGSLLGRRVRGAAAILALVAGCLAAAAVLGRLGLAPLAAAAMAFAMGAENAVFERDDDIPFGVTYMTGALVKVGQRLALALTGGPRWAWAPFLLLWAGLVLGAAAGALTYPGLGLDALWPASAAALLCAGLSGRLLTTA